MEEKKITITVTDSIVNFKSENMNQYEIIGLMEIFAEKYKQEVIDETRMKKPRKPSSKRSKKPS